MLYGAALLILAYLDRDKRSIRRGIGKRRRAGHLVADPHDQCRFSAAPDRLVDLGKRQLSPIQYEHGYAPGCSGYAYG